MKTGKSIKTAEIRLWKWFSIYIRLRDSESFTGYASCITCGRKKQWREMDCGHGIPRQYKCTKYNEQNNHAQCKRCNAFEGGRMDLYAKSVDEKYGDGSWEKLIVASRRTIKHGAIEYEIMSDFYKKEAEKIAKKKSLTI